MYCHMPAVSMWRCREYAGVVKEGMCVSRWGGGCEGNNRKPGATVKQTGVCAAAMLTRMGMLHGGSTWLPGCSVLKLRTAFALDTSTSV